MTARGGPVMGDEHGPVRTTDHRRRTAEVHRFAVGPRPEEGTFMGRPAIIDRLATDLPIRLRKPVLDRDYFEVDLEVPRSYLRRLEERLEAEGLQAWSARGRRGHRYFLTFEAGRWVKYDIVVDPAPRRRPRLDAVARRLPAGTARRGAVVAVVGPDGADKDAVLAALRHAIPVGTHVVRFQGSRHSDTANRRLRRVSGPAGARGDGLPRTWRRRRQLLGPPNSLYAPWLLARAYLWAWQGRLVLCDIDGSALPPDHPTAASSIASAPLVSMRDVTLWPDAVITVGRTAQTPAVHVRAESTAVLEPTDRDRAQVVTEASAIIWAAAVVRHRTPARSFSRRVAPGPVPTADGLAGRAEGVVSARVRGRP